MSGIGIPQTDYGFSPVLAIAGMVAVGSLKNEIVHYPASAKITPGTLVELVSGQVRPAQAATGALKPLVGVAIYKNTKGRTPAETTNGSYQVGEMVPVLRKGRVFANWVGTTQGELTALNYVHSTTAAFEQGYFTDAATSSTSGHEIDAAKTCVSVKATGLTAVCLVELNLPADS